MPHDRCHRQGLEARKLEPIVAYLGLGSNLGQRDSNLVEAVACLTDGGNLSVIRASSIYETAPWGYTDQPSFLNCVLEVETTLAPEPLLDLAKALERFLGRKATFRYGPRAIDIDILLYGSRVVDLPPLQIPHPRMCQRAFVLTPLAELSSGLVHPVCGATIDALARRLAQGLARGLGRGVDNNLEGTQEVRLWPTSQGLYPARPPEMGPGS